MDIENKRHFGARFRASGSKTWPIQQIKKRQWQWSANEIVETNDNSSRQQAVFQYYTTLYLKKTAQKQSKYLEKCNKNRSFVVNLGALNFRHQSIKKN